MEARRYGFDDPRLVPADKFDPTDEDIVAHYLLPRATGVPNPYAHAVIDDDAYSCPPWELLRRHGYGDCVQAFVFGPPRDMERNAGRTSRTGVDKDFILVRGGGGCGGQRWVMFQRYNLSYYEDGDDSSSGWVMHEYHIVNPRLVPGAVVACIKITQKGKRKQQLQAEAAAAAVARAVAPGPDQPGPSNYLYDYYGHDFAGNAAAAAAVTRAVAPGPDQPGPSNYLYDYYGHDAAGNAADNGYNNGGGGGGKVMGEMVGAYCTDGFLNDDDGNNNYFDSDAPGPSYYLGGLHDAAGNSAVAFSDDGAGTSGHAALQPPGSEIVHHGDFDYGGGAVGEMAHGYYTNLLNFGEADGYYVDDGSYFNQDIISHYFNQDAGSAGDDSTTENKTICKPTSDTPPATKEKGSS